MQEQDPALPDPAFEHAPRERAESDLRDRLSLFANALRATVSDISGGLSLIDRGRLDDGSAVQLDRLRETGNDLVRLIDESLSDMLGEPGFTAALSGVARVSLVDLLQEVVHRATPAARARGITLETVQDGRLPLLVASDRATLGSLLDRLLEGAIGAEQGAAGQGTAEQGGTVRLTVSLPDDEELRFVLATDRPGPPPAPEVLQPCQNLADSIGGRLLLPPPDGAWAVLVLPPSAWHGSGRNPALRPDGLPDLGGLRVLVAEDNPTSQTVLFRMLSQMQAAAVLAEDGRRALDHLFQGGFDMALVDIEMPELAGTEVMRAVRALPDARAQIPILAVTAYVLRAQRELIYAAGADGIVAKPVMSVEALGEAIARLIQRGPHTPDSQPVPPDPPTLWGIAPEHVTAVDAAVLEQLLNLAGPEGREELRAQLEIDLHTASVALSAAVRAGDLDGVRAQTHVLISLAGTAGAEGLQEIMQGMNAAAHDQDQDMLRAALPHAEAGLARVLGLVRAMAPDGTGGAGAGPADEQGGA